jgi:hypothetical protein
MMFNRLRSFLKLGAIVGGLPYNILDGQLIQAVPVMSNFNWIVSQINANIPPLITTGGGTPTYVPAGQVAGTANAITLTPTIPNTGYAAGQRYSFKPTAANSGPTTVAVSALAAKSVLAGDGSALTGGEWNNLGIVDIQYNGTAFILLNESQGSGILTFTPTLSFGGASAGLTYGVQTGNYMKIGRMVHFSLDILLSNKGGSVGDSQIAGLPYPCNIAWPTGGFGASMALQIRNVGFSTGVDCYATAGLVPSTSTINIYTNITNGAINRIGSGSFNNNSELIVSGFYPV